MIFDFSWIQKIWTKIFYKNKGVLYTQGVQDAFIYYNNFRKIYCIVSTALLALLTGDPKLP